MDKPINPESKEKNPGLERGKKHFLAAFSPVAAFQPNVIFRSTSEICTMLKDIYSAAEYYESEIADWLEANGFTIVNTTSDKFEWMLLHNA